MRREAVCADKWRGKEIVFLRHFPRTNTKTSLQYTRTSNANRFKFFHHVDLPDYLMFAQDDRAERNEPGCQKHVQSYCNNNYIFCFLQNVSDLSRQFCFCQKCYDI